MEQSSLSYLRVIALTLAIWLALSGFFSLAHAQSSNTLPDYVIDEYGEPPEVPVGPLSRELQLAAALAFIDGTKLTTWGCLLYTSPSPRDGLLSRMPSSA